MKTININSIVMSLEKTSTKIKLHKTEKKGLNILVKNGKIETSISLTNADIQLLKEFLSDEKL
jgi:hypothetical protein